MTLSNVFLTGAALALSLAAAGAALAAPMSVDEAFKTFNAITQGDLNSSQEIEGRVYVGGNLTGGTMQVGFKDVAPSPFDELIVEGNKTSGTLNMQNGSDATIRGNASGTIELNGGTQGTRTARIGGSFTGNANQGTLLQGQAAADPNFDARFPEIDFMTFVDTSNYLAGLPGDTLSFPDQNQKQIFGSTVTTPFSVLNVTLAQLSGGTFFVDNRQSGFLIVNVSGTSGTIGGNVAGGTGAAEHVVWNFYEATSITVNTAIVGSVLAPLATMSGFGGSTEGSVIAKAINLTNGELHSRTFQGTLPAAAPPPPPATIPLPTGLPLLLAGLGGLAMLRRRAA